MHLVQNARSAIAMDFHTNCYKQPPGLVPNATTDRGSSSGADPSHQSSSRVIDVDPQQQLDSPDYTFTLPDISIYSDDFRRFLEKDLIEGSTLSSLEQAQRLNWWAEAGYCRKLWPLSTSGDGNCLLHAASLALWGFHDRKLTLRTALHGVLTHGTGPHRDALWRRWRFQQTRLNKQAGFVYSEVEWAREWEDIVALASPEPRRQSPSGCRPAVANGCSKAGSVSRRRSMVMDGGRSGASGTAAAGNSGTGAGGADSFDENATYESLEEIHIFALAHVLRRTIIVVADTVLRDMNGEAMAPIPFGGVYLPFEIPVADCHRAPLLLTYDMAHFSALVSMEETPAAPVALDAESCGAPACIPLLDIDNVLLPIQFCIDPGVGFAWTEYDGAEGNWALTDREHIALLKEFLDVVHVSPLGSPDDELCDDSDEEFEGATLQQHAQPDDLAASSSAAVPTADGSANGKSKAAKQLQSVAKQFGSIGKSMSKKIKKNIGSITKIGQTPAVLPASGAAASNDKYASGSASKKSSLLSAGSVQSFNRRRILCAQLKAKRYDYQEEMIRNYLECAQDRFLDAERVKQQTATARGSVGVGSGAGSGSDYTDGSSANGGSLRRSKTLATQSSYTDDATIATCCINAGCQNYGTAATSYMCFECFEKQKEQELNSALMDPVARYGAGNSRFYTQSDQRSHAQIQRIPSVKRLNELDQTLYLSNSTFYNDQRNQPNIQPSDHQQQQLQQDAVEQQYLQNGFRSASSYGIPGARTAAYDDDLTERHSHRSGHQRPVGSATVYSPGRTIIHHIVRQTVELPPPAPASASVADSAQLVPRAAYESAGRSSQPPPATAMHGGSVVTAMGGIATPFGQARTCRTDGCMFYGSASSNYFCSKCCQQAQLDGGGRASYGSSGGGPVGSGTYSKVLTDV